MCFLLLIVSLFNLGRVCDAVSCDDNSVISDHSCYLLYYILCSSSDAFGLMTGRASGNSGV